MTNPDDVLLRHDAEGLTKREALMALMMVSTMIWDAIVNEHSEHTNPKQAAAMARLCTDAILQELNKNDA